MRKTFVTNTIDESRFLMWHIDNIMADFLIFSRDQWSLTIPIDRGESYLTHRTWSPWIVLLGRTKNVPSGWFCKSRIDSSRDISSKYQLNHSIPPMIFQRCFSPVFVSSVKIGRYSSLCFIIHPIDSIWNWQDEEDRDICSRMKIKVILTSKSMRRWWCLKAVWRDKISPHVYLDAWWNSSEGVNDGQSTSFSLAVLIISFVLMTNGKNAQIIVVRRQLKLLIDSTYYGVSSLVEQNRLDSQH